MPLTKKTNHSEEAQGRLLEQFRESEKFKALVASYAAQVQELENVLFQLIDDRTIDTAVGVQLDGIGQIVGQAREGRTDDQYRLILKTRITINNSSGTVEDIIAVCDAVTGANTIEVQQYFPKAVNVILTDALVEDPDEVEKIVESVVDAGVNLVIEYRISPEGEIFSFATGDTIETSSTQGMANDAGTTGGKFADVEDE